MKKEKTTKELFLNADSPADRAVQQKLIRAVNDALLKGEAPEEDEIEIFIEDALGSSPVSMRKARKLLNMTGAYTLRDGALTYNDELTVDGKKIGLREFADLFLERTKILDLDTSSRNAVLSGTAWTMSAVLLARDNSFQGLPAFYSCDGDKDSLIGINVAETATSDALSILCRFPDNTLNCGKPADEIIECIDFLTEKTIALQCGEPGWDQGGFYPKEDQPESYHPTVDATCLAVISLCALYENKNGIEAAIGKTLSVENGMIEAAVLGGLDFLFRMQRPDGSFGIYRYETGLSALPSENCTRIAQSTMGVCKGSGVFDNTERFDMYPACSKVIADTYGYLTSHTADAGDYSIWAPYFGKRAMDYSAADAAVSASRVCRSFIPVWWQMEDQRENITRYNRDFLRFWRDNLNGIENKVGRYRFNSPAKDGFSVGEYFWPARADMLSAFSVLLAHNEFELELSDGDWKMIEDTVRRTLELQHPHGHWDNPLAVKTPFSAVTLAAIELLQEYRKAKGLDK